MRKVDKPEVGRRLLYYTAMKNIAHPIAPGLSHSIPSSALSRMHLSNLSAQQVRVTLIKDSDGRAPEEFTTSSSELNL